ncbi:MAG: hypothetical protein WCI62_00205 [Erysipelotrichaceae bacterium]
MKKILSLLVLVLVVGTFTACARTLKTCDVATLDGTTVCYDEKLKEYAIETGAELVVNLDNDAFGNALVALWDAKHPEFAGKLTFVNNGAAGTTDALAVQTTEYADVTMAIDGEVSRNVTHLLAIDPVLAKLIKANAVDTFYQAGNTTGVTVYAPMTYDGMAFIWNETMLTALGLSVADANNDNLPDAFDTWEEIFALSTTWKTTRPTYNEKPVNSVFPLSLGEVWSGYMALTSTGWNIFATGDATKPGYDDAKFKSSFQFLVDAKAAAVEVNALGETLTSDNMGWRWDAVLADQSAPFGLVGTWMDPAKAATDNNVVFHISALPTYKGNHLTPFVKTKGFVINGYTAYKSAATELLRLIYSIDGFQAMVDGTAYSPSLVDKSKLAPELAATGVQAQMMKAFVYNYPEPFYTLPNNKTKKGMDSAFYPFMSNTMRAVWDGTKTVDEAVAELISLSDAAILADNVTQ